MMTAPEPDGIVWRTSSFSGNSGNCVEVAPAPDGVLVRDSKDPGGPALTVPTAAWRAFLVTLPADYADLTRGDDRPSVPLTT